MMETKDEGLKILGLKIVAGFKFVPLPRNLLSLFLLFFQKLRWRR